MNNKIYFAINLFFLIVPLLNFAEAASDCSDVLIPTYEQSKSDYSMIQAYMYLNAEKEFDEWKKSDSSSLSSNASYKMFSAEFNQAHSSDEFKMKVHDRLRSENSFTNETDAIQYSKRYLSEVQIKAWLDCQYHKDGGYITLIPRDVDQSSFTLRVEYSPQVGVGGSDIDIVITNGNYNGKKTIKRKYNSATKKSYLISFDSNEDVKIIANAIGLTDSLTVKKKVNKPLVIEQPLNQVNPNPPLVDISFDKNQINQSPVRKFIIESIGNNYYDNTTRSSFKFKNENGFLIDTSALNFINMSFSFAFWLQIDQMPNPNEISFVLGRHYAHGIRSYDIHVRDNKIAFELFGDKDQLAGPGRLSEHEFINSETEIKTGEWYQIIAVYDNDKKTMDLYINGRLEAQKNLPGSFNAIKSTPNLPTTFGCYYAKDPSTQEEPKIKFRSFLNGKLSNIRIYDYALPSSAISILN